MIARARAAALLAAFGAVGGCGALLNLSDVGYGDADGGLDGSTADTPRADATFADGEGADAAASDVARLDGACATPPDLSADCGAGLLRCEPAGDCVYSAATDRNHCGVCERACDGTCAKGTCAQIPIAGSGGAVANIRAVALDAVWGYWLVDGQAYRQAVDAGGASDAITGQYAGLWDLVVDTDGRFYHVSTGGFERSGGGGGAEHLRDIAGSPGARLVLDDARAYWTEGVDGGGDIGSALKDGGGYVSLASGQVAPDDIVLVHPGQVVFASRAAGTIQVADLALPGSPTTRIQSLVRLRAVVGRDGWGYYLAGADDGGTDFEIWRFDLTTFARSKIAGGLDDADNLAVDDTFVYASTRLDGGFAIYRVPKCGGAPSLVTGGVTFAPSGVVVSSKHLAWVDGTTLVQTTK